jgi:hypothetical protein
LGSRAPHWRRVVWLARRTASVRCRAPGLSRLALIVTPCIETPENPLQIDDGDHLWRRFRDDPNHLVWDDELGPIPHHEVNSVLQFDEDLSTSWREHLEWHHMRPVWVLGENPAYTLVGEISVSAARELDFGITHSSQDIIPIDCAHASVSWPASHIHAPAKRPDKPTRSRLRSQIARNFTFVYGEVKSEPPPGR